MSERRRSRSRSYDRSAKRGRDERSDRYRNEKRHSRSRSPRKTDRRDLDRRTQDSERYGSNRLHRDKPSNGDGERHKDGRQEKRENIDTRKSGLDGQNELPKKEDAIEIAPEESEALLMSMMGDDVDDEAEKAEQRRMRRATLMAKHQIVVSPAPLKVLPVVLPQIEDTPLSPPKKSVYEEVPPPRHPGQPLQSSSSSGNAAEKEEGDEEKEVTQGRQRADSVGFDIFSSSPVPDQPAPKEATRKSDALQNMGTDAHLEDNWDDGEGYYITRIGEIIGARYVVRGALGKGVFSTVLSCHDRDAIEEGNAVVAIKLIRNNDVMRKAALKETNILHEIALHDIEDKRHCIRLLSAFDHRSHTAMVFDSYAMNLRETLKKFGKGVGINIKSVKAYTKQLLIALKHIASLRIVHADIKPDNILVSEDFRVVKLCDFGSAFKETDPDNDPTPYLQSRFYRAPEITLALDYNRQIDLWSVACCAFELFTGNIMFPGRDNNHMLSVIMDMKGRFANKTLKKHMAAYEQLERLPHFTEDFRFRQVAVDKVTGKPVVRFVDINPQPVVSIKKTLLASKAGADDQRLVVEAADLLEKMCCLEPEKRIQVKACLEHPFIKGPAPKASKGGEVVA